MRRLLILLFLLLCWTVPLLADDPPEPLLDVRYREVPQPEKLLDGSLEVILFFWYGCSSCYSLDRSEALREWEENLPEDVVFIRMPTLNNPSWDLHARVFLTLQTMRVPRETHLAVFTAIQEQRIRVREEEDLPKLCEELGVSEPDFRQVFHSQGVQDSMDLLAELVEKYGLAAVPSMVVNGRYVYDLDDSGAEGFLPLANHLLDLERQAGR